MEENILERKNKEHKEIKNREVWELRFPIETLLGELRESIEKGKYKVIIGDDVSARIPTLIINNIIKKYNEEKKEKAPQLFFIPGSGRIEEHLGGSQEGKQEDIENYVLLEYFKPLKTEDRVLICTDWIQSGLSLKPLVRALREYGIKYDIATIGLPNGYIDLEGLKGDDSIIYAGSSDVPKIYHNRELSGVVKDPRSTRSDTIKYSDENNPKNKIIQEKINQAREAISILSEELYDWFKKKKKWGEF